MENIEKKTPLNDLMDTTMDKIRDMVDSNTIIGERFGGGAGAGVKVDPVAFLIVKDGMTRVMPVAMPAATTVDRVLDLVPEVLDRMQNFVDKKREEKDIY